MFFLRSIKAIIKEKTNEVIIKIGKALVLVLIDPKGTFIPRKEDIIVGIDSTIVAPAKNFIIMFKLLETMVA